MSKPPEESPKQPKKKSPKKQSSRKKSQTASAVTDVQALTDLVGQMQEILAPVIQAQRELNELGDSDVQVFYDFRITRSDGESIFALQQTQIMRNLLQTGERAADSTQQLERLIQLMLLNPAIAALQKANDLKMLAEEEEELQQQPGLSMGSFGLPSPDDNRPPLPQEAGGQDALEAEVTKVKEGKK